MNLAVIPARSGSRRVVDKNIRLFAGKPMMAHSIITARESKLFNEIIVSTDSQQYAAIAKAYGAKVHMRPARYCENNVGTQDVARCVLNWWNVCHPKRTPQYACVIYATAPLMTVEDLQQGFKEIGSGLYARPIGPDGTDPGQWYAGRAEAFLRGIPLEKSCTLYPIPEWRACDINTEDDWQRAEILYAQLRQSKKISDAVDNHVMEELNK